MSQTPSRSLFRLLVSLTSLAYGLVAYAVPGIHPIVDVQAHYLIGGVVNSKWTGAHLLATMMHSSTKYRLYSMARCYGTATGTEPVCLPGTPASLPPAVRITIPKAAANVRDLIGVSGMWNALPRKVSNEYADQSVYQQTIKNYLTKNHLANGRVHITQILRVDLEGDGHDEAIISATSPDADYLGTHAKKGTYSFVVVRKVVKGNVVTIPLSSEFHNTEEKTPANAYTVAAVLDVNGDGIMEIIVNYAYYDGHGKIVHQVHDGNAKSVLSAGYSIIMVGT